MKIDNKFIELISSNNSLNKEQFRILDLPFPEIENWKELACQKEISRNDANILMLLKGKLSLKAQEQIIKNYHMVLEFNNIKLKKVEEKSVKESTVNKIVNETTNVDKVDKKEVNLSLMDKLVLDAKENLETKTVEIVKSDKVEDNIDKLDSKKNISLIDKIIDNEKKVNIDKQAINSKENDSKEIKTLEKNDLKTDNKSNTQIKENIEVEVSTDIKKESKKIDLNESKIDSKNEVKNNKIESNSDNITPKNEKVASELSKISNIEKEIKVSLPKEEIASLKNSVEKKESSLIDKILNESKVEVPDSLENIKEIDISKKVEHVKKEQVSLEEMMKNARNASTSTSVDSKEEMMKSIYMSTQRKTISDKNLEIKNEALKTVKDGSSTADVEKGAKILNLGLESQEIKIEEPLLNTKIDNTKLSSTFDRLSLFSNSVKEAISNNKSNISESLLKDNPKDEKVLQLNVNSSAVQTIQNKIIGAKQQMASMMSDLARTKYENYKPPVTAFRINLNPASLGSIAIVLRNEQRNSISINMSVSNSSTKEALIENQSSLRSSLIKTFEGNTSFNLDINSIEENYSNTDNQNNENPKEDSPKNEFQSSSEIINNRQKLNDEKEISKEQYSYM